MRERPILFSAPMVRALLDGTKTQTRRIVKDPTRLPPNPANYEHNGCAFVLTNGSAASVYPMSCPYGQPGDQLWVRETWQGPLLDEFEVDADADWHMPNRIHQYQNPAHCVYAADGGPAPEFTDADDNQRSGWRPSIHMNRWASRITLEVAEVRVERLQDISTGDAIAEGVHGDSFLRGDDDLMVGQIMVELGITAPVARYVLLWDSINGTEPNNWNSNPWVWCISFRRIKP